MRKAAGGFALAALLLAVMIVSAGFAGAGDAAYRIIDTKGLKAMVDSEDRNFLLIDARNPEEYMEAHIPGAINIPEKKLEASAGILPADRNAAIVFYCNGIKCGKSKKSAEKAAKLGYANIIVYSEGMPVWEESGYPFFKSPSYEERIETTKIAPRDLKALMDSGAKVTVIDVRETSEFNEGHIPGAMNISLEKFAFEGGMLDKEHKIVVYCNSGGRSYSAYRKLMRMAYKDIAQAIFADWKEAGLPVAKQKKGAL